MRKIKSLVMLLLAFSFLLAGEALYAQEPPGRSFPEKGKRARVKEEIETMKMWKMLEALNLSPEQSDKFLPAWRELQKAQKVFRERRDNLFRMLEMALMEEKAKEVKIKDILFQLEKERIFLDEVQQRFREKAKEILTLEQQAKLLLFEEKFEKRMMDIIRQYREKRQLGE
ncbi:MAG: hypothetical protein Q8N71_03145 [candidate division Zixibacteria bacterium]|nr:hypothetical protein [candidate division Zixibacteria bacterium]